MPSGLGVMVQHMPEAFCNTFGGWQFCTEGTSLADSCEILSRFFAPHLVPPALATIGHQTLAQGYSILGCHLIWTGYLISCLILSPSLPVLVGLSPASRF